MLVSQNVLGSIASSSVLGEEFEKGRYQIFFECLVELTSKAIWSWIFIFGRFLMVVSISSLFISLDFPNLHALV